MTEFLGTMGPILLLWSVPLIPLTFTSIVTLVESMGTSSRGLVRESGHFRLSRRTSAENGRVERGRDAERP